MYHCRSARAHRAYGAVAQLVAHHTGSVGVRGSSPLGSTTISLLLEQRDPNARSASLVGDTSRNAVSLYVGARVASFLCPASTILVRVPLGRCRRLVSVWRCRAVWPGGSTCSARWSAATTGAVLIRISLNEIRRPLARLVLNHIHTIGRCWVVQMATPTPGTCQDQPLQTPQPRRTSTSIHIMNAGCVL